MSDNSLWGLISKKPQELSINEITLVNYYNWLKSLAVSMFKWEGMPDTIDIRYLENALFEKGNLLFFKDPILGYLALKCLPTSDLNVYGRPVEFQVVSHSYSNKIKADEGVRIFNNDIEEPSQFTIGAYASRLSEIERTTDINMNAQKTPILIQTDRKQLLTLRNVYQQYKGNAPVIFADKNMFTDESLKVLNTQAPYIIDKLDVHKQNIWNEALTFLGIQNADTDKKERLIVDEVNANNEHIQMNANVMLKARERACTEINEMFPDLNVSVSLRYQPEDIEDEEERCFFTDEEIGGNDE